MSDGQIRVKIGAAADRSVEATFSSLEKRAVKMAQNVQRTLGSGQMFNQLGTGAERATTQAERAFKRTADTATREAKRAEREVEKSYQQQQRALEKVAREQDRIHSQQMRAEARAAAASERLAEASARRKIALQNRSFAMEQRAREQQYRAAERRAHEEDSWQRKAAYRTAYHGIMRHFPGILGHAGSFAGDMARGAGVNIDFTESFRRNIERQSEAVGLAQQERMATGTTIGGAGYEKIAGSVAGNLKTDPTKVLELMRAFTGSSGAYKPIQEHAQDIAAIAIAKGADLGETGQAAGKLYTKLGDMNAVVGIMRALGGEAAAGMFESRDMMSKIGKITGGAYKFQGGSAVNIPKLFALAEGAGEGGADSAPQAATAVANFVSMFTKPARYKKLEAALGHSLFNKDGTAIQDPVETVFEVISRFKGNLKEIGRLVPEANAQKIFGGYAAAYSEAGGGAAGEAAMRAKYQRIAGASLTEEVERQNLADHLGSISAQAQEFRNQFDLASKEMMANMLPALKELSPALIRGTKALSSFVSFATEHWGAAIAIAFTAAIARAGIETILREGIERMILGRSATGGGIITAAGFAGGVRGVVGRAPAAILGGVGGYLAGDQIDELAGSKKAGTFADIGAGAGVGAAFGPIGALIGAGAGAIYEMFKTGGSVDQLGQQLRSYDGKQAHVVDPEEYERRYKAFVASGAAKEAAKPDATQLGKAVGDGLQGRVLRVEVVNVGAFKAGTNAPPEADDTGRSKE